MFHFCWSRGKGIFFTPLFRLTSYVSSPYLIKWQMLWISFFFTTSNIIFQQWLGRDLSKSSLLLIPGIQIIRSEKVDFMEVWRIHVNILKVRVGKFEEGSQKLKGFWGLCQLLSVSLHIIQLSQKLEHELNCDHIYIFHWIFHIVFFFKFPNFPK